MRLRGQEAARLREFFIWSPAIAAAAILSALTHACRHTSPEFLHADLESF